MATYYSDLFAGLSTPTTLDGQKRAGAGVGHARLRYAISRFDPGEAVAVSSTVRMKTFKSGDRLNQLLLTSNDSGSTGDIDVGIYKTGSNHDGVEVNADLFATAQDINAAARFQLDIINEADTVSYLHRGQPLWQQAGLSADPMEDWDIVVTYVEASTDAAHEMYLEFFYTSGD